MRRTLILLGVILLGVLLGIGLVKIPGIFILELGQKTFAAPLWFVLLSLIFLILILYWLIKLFCFALNLPFEWKASWLNFKNKRREKLFREAINNQLLGEHGLAWEKFKNLAKSNYLIPQTYYLAAHSARIAGEPAITAELLAEAKQLGFSLIKNKK